MRRLRRNELARVVESKPGAWSADYQAGFNHGVQFGDSRARQSMDRDYQNKIRRFARVDALLVEIGAWEPKKVPPWDALPANEDATAYLDELHSTMTELAEAHAFECREPACIMVSSGAYWEMALCAYSWDDRMGRFVWTGLNAATRVKDPLAGAQGLLASIQRVRTPVAGKESQG